MRVLIVEYLHAQSEAHELASDSMLAEGKMMLDAIIEDLSQLNHVLGFVTVCDAAARKITTGDATILPVSSGPEANFDEQLLTACTDQAFDKVLLVAPECGGILTTITRRLRHRQLDVVGLSLQAISVCTDKLSTIQFLQRHRIPSIPTRPLTQLPRLQTTDRQLVVVKPRDGAGCDGIIRLSTAELIAELMSLGRPAAAGRSEFDYTSSVPVNHSAVETPGYLNSPEDFIVQPLIEGASYSIGIIGRGEGSAAIVLPIAKQKIAWHNGRPIYSGGVIPAAVSNRIQKEASAIAHDIAAAMQMHSGYMGVDFVVDDASQQVFVSEINPRLCTSYVGYRKATTTNLLAVLLHQHDASEVSWSTSPIEFQI